MFIWFLILQVFCSYGCNYASSICGSYIVYSSKNISRPESLFSDAGYSIGNCVPGSIVLQLCNDVKIKTIQIENKEYLSSFVRKIRFSSFIDGEWEHLGEFDCEFTRKKQEFNISSVFYTRILKIEFLEFLGKHSIFTLNSLKVFGETVLDNLKLDDGNVSKFTITEQPHTELTRYFGTITEFEGLLQNMLFLDKIIKSMKKYVWVFLYMAIITFTILVFIKKVL